MNIIFCIGIGIFVGICIGILSVRFVIYCSCSKKTDGELVSWDTMSFVHAKSRYYPIFQYEYLGKSYQARSLSGWSGHVPTITSGKHPIWINPNHPKYMTIRKSDYKGYSNM